jgi:hypothetical protein
MSRDLSEVERFEELDRNVNVLRTFTRVKRGPMTLKLTWKVADAPTGRYRAFDRRAWPTAWYGKPGVEGVRPAAFLSCTDAYSPARVREGAHAEIKISVLHHNHAERKPWAVMTLTKRSR